MKHKNKFEKKEVEVVEEKVVVVPEVPETKTGTDINWINPTPTIVRDNPNDN